MLDRKRLVTAVLLITGTASAYGHHSFSALFDARQTITVSGEVVAFEFQAPHSYIILDVADDGGAESTWQIETATPGMLIRKGITPDTLRAGDRISASGNPTRDGRNLMRLLTITMADGQVLQVQ